MAGHTQTAIKNFQTSAWIAKILGCNTHGWYVELKQSVANGSARKLGTFVYTSEVWFLHEIYNLPPWNRL